MAFKNLFFLCKHKGLFSYTLPKFPFSFLLYYLLDSNKSSEIVIFCWRYMGSMYSSSVLGIRLFSLEFGDVHTATQELVSVLKQL